MTGRVRYLGGGCGEQLVPFSDQVALSGVAGSDASRRRLRRWGNGLADLEAATKRLDAAAAGSGAVALAASMPAG